MFGIRKSIATALIVGGLSASAVKADGPTVPPVNPAPATPAQPQQLAKSMTIDQLGQLLTSAGLTVTPNKDASGAVQSYYALLEWSNGWKSPFTFSLSRNQNYVWINVGLQDLTNPNAVPADVLLKILHSNQDTGTTFFFVDSANTLRFYTMASVDSLTPDLLKLTVKQIEDFVMSTANLWSQQALGQVPPPPAQLVPVPPIQPAPPAQPVIPTPPPPPAHSPQHG